MLHILLNTLGRLLLNHENYSLRIILFQKSKQYSCSCLKLQMPHFKHFRWKDTKNKSCKSYLGDKNKRQLRRAFLFCGPIFFALEKSDTIKFVQSWKINSSLLISSFLQTKIVRKKCNEKKVQMCGLLTFCQVCYESDECNGFLVYVAFRKASKLGVSFDV